ncbi:MAG: aspartyl-trna synthetase [Rhodobacteraceae bacterium]|nr:MAG: aspartyl-trna synthetase [Paracoccaceae bacterium]
MTKRILWTWLLVGLLAGLLGAAPAIAQAVERGPVTNLPLPRYVSLKASEGNARRGPDQSHRIDWVFTRRDIPLRVTAEFEHWRRVEDVDGQGGWMHHALLSGLRTVIVQTDMTQLFSRPDGVGTPTALLERGVIARLRECQRDWCRVEVEGLRGWTEKRHLWGVEVEDEFD